MFRRLIWLLASACVAGAADVPRILTPEDAVRLALENRAELDAAEAMIAVEEGAALQASLRPNPTFSLQTENWRAWGDPSLRFGRDMNIFLSASQTIETGGKRRLRTAQAEAGSEVARLEADVFAWGVRSDVLAAYERVRAADERVALADRVQSNHRELVRYHRLRFEEGAGAELDLVRVQTALYQAEAAREAASIGAEQARFDLFRAMGLAPGSEPVRLEASEPPVEPPPTVESGIAAHPQLRLAAARVERARRSVELSAARAKPDVTPYFGYKRDGPFNSLIGGVSVPLTVSDRRQGERAGAAAELRRAEAEMRAAEALVSSRVRAALSAWRSSAALVQSVSAGATDKAEEAYRIVFAAYEENAVDLTDVLKAQEVRNETELLVLEAGARYRSARRDFEAALGGMADSGLMQEVR